MQNSIEAERAVIGAMLIDESIIPEISMIIEPADFYLPSAGRAFGVILQLVSDGKPVDLLTVDGALRALGYQEPTAADLATWADEGAIPSHAAAHAEAVKKYANGRAVTRACQDTLARINEQGEDPHQVGEDLAAKVIDIGMNRHRQFVSLQEGTIAALKTIERATGENAVKYAVPTGLWSIDRRTGGLYRGDLILMAGRTSMGKSAMALGIVEGAARAGYTAAVVSCESPTNSIILRLLSKASGIENRNLRRGHLEDRDFPRISFAAGQISDLPIYLFDRERSWEAIKAALRALKMRKPELALVAVDYVQLLKLRTREDRWQQIGQISAEAKELALELDVPFILLSQISRDVEKRQDKRPTMSDLRESGNLEQDADVIGLLFRPHYYDKSALPDLAELNIAKSRDGETGVIDLVFDEKTASFSDPLDETEAQGSFL